MQTKPKNGSILYNSSARRIMLLLVLSLFDCSFGYLGILSSSFSSNRCLSVSVEVRCDCVTHSDGELHVSCLNSGIRIIPTSFTIPSRLELKDNAIQTVQEINYPSLRQLRLTQNQIHNIQDYAFINLENLTMVSLAHNLIKTLTSETFVGLRNLELLNLEDNPLTDIKSEVFTGINLPKLQFLKLSNCRIHTIESGSFGGLHHLFQLNLSSNHIRKLPVLGDDSSLPRLSDLDLSNNRLQNLVGSSMKHLTSLSHLLLNRNNLTHLNNRAFPSSVKMTLRSLWLRDNYLSYMDPGTLKQLEALSILDISFNLFKEIDSTEIPDSLDKFLVHNNLWNCSCGKNQWLTRNPVVQKWNAEAQIICASPESLRGVNAYDEEAMSEMNDDCEQSEKSVDTKQPTDAVLELKVWISALVICIGIGILAITALTFSVVVYVCSRRRNARRSILGSYLKRKEDDSMRRLLNN